jgi:ribosomal protein L16/L10AE
MGKGKGKLRHWCVQFLKASTFFEVELRPDFLTRTALKLVKIKAPARVETVRRLAWLDRFSI